MKAGDYEGWDDWVAENWPDQDFSAWDPYRLWLIERVAQDSAH